MAQTGSMTLPRELSRSRGIFFLSLSFLGSALLSFLIGSISPFAATVEGQFSVQASIILDIAGSVVTLICWVSWKPDYSSNGRPLGITILALGTGLAGIVLAAEGLLLLFLPVVGLGGVVIGGFGLGAFFLARGLWIGKRWSLDVMSFLTAISVIIGTIFLLISGIGTPVLVASEFWYLRRPHLRRFFYDSLETIPPYWDTDHYPLRTS
jgi:hypothetical protein